jgi:hypothetical protein
MRWGKPKDAPASPAGGWSVTGEPLPGTEAAVAAIEHGADGGLAAVAALDPSFNTGAFVAWSATVYDRAVAAWRSRDPEPLRPVMGAAVWDSYAKHLLFVSTVPLAQSLMGAAKGTPSLVGVSADGGHESAVVEFAVVTDPAAYAAWKLPAEHGTWTERWLFQRADSYRTHESGAVAVCPVCGAPAQPEETGRCRYCHADVTSRTAGWLVTRTETTAPGMAKMDDRLARVRAAMSSRITLPPAPVAAPPLQPPRAGP